MPDIFNDTRAFNSLILGMPPKNKPTRLSLLRKGWAVTAFEEEVEEFKDATNIADEADALIDLIYFAAGRLYEMGLNGGPLWNEVHNANLHKQRGELSKRPGSEGYDAIKPEGWVPPDMVKVVMAQFPKPKIAVVGHARHGKDTVSEIICKQYHMEFVSSSMFCAEKVIWPLATSSHRLISFVDEHAGEDQDLAGVLYTQAKEIYDTCLTPVDAFNCRSKHRAFWFNAISSYCNPPDRLAREILEENDIYCGIRSPRELQAAKDAGLFDAVIWVDALDRLDPEPSTSMGITREMADYCVDNNGPEHLLPERVARVMDQIMETVV